MGDLGWLLKKDEINVVLEKIGEMRAEQMTMSCSTQGTLGEPLAKG